LLAWTLHCSLRLRTHLHNAQPLLLSVICSSTRSTTSLLVAMSTVAAIMQLLFDRCDVPVAPYALGST
jgi:hypothetical protein